MLRTCHLFAGIGGGLLADLILGHKPVVAVEWEPYACQVLRERAADGWFPGLQVWEGDVRMFDPSEYVGRVDCIHAGFPCQDISLAGRQSGVGEETRSGLYREVLRIAGVVRPRYIFLENVAAIVSNGLGTVLSDLAALGYDSEWLCLRASDCGAPHHRDRWWLLADSASAGSEARRRNGLGVIDGPRRDKRFAESAGCEKRGMADSERFGLSGQREPVAAINPEAAGDWQATESVDGGFGDFWRIESSVGRVATRIPHRVQRLKGLGNAQVPLQAAVAFTLLAGGLK